MDTPMERNKVEELLECSICVLRMEQPKQLSCGHTFCSNCIDNLINNGQVLCPTCRGTTCIPPGGLPINFCVLKIISQFEEDPHDYTSCSCCFSRIEGRVHFLCRSCRKGSLCAVCCLKDHRNHEIEEKRPATSSEIMRAIVTIDSEVATILHNLYTVENLWDLSPLQASLVEHSDAMFQAYERIVSKLHSENVLTDQLNSASNTAANIRSLFTSLCNKIEDRQKKMTEACLIDIVEFSNALDGIMAANVCDFNGDNEA